MTINSLANFGVPGMNGDRSAVLQPIFSNRFRVLFFNFGAANEPAPYDLTRQIKTINRPTVRFEVQNLYSYASTVYVVNRGEWDEMSVVFFDDITNSVQQRVQNQIAKQQNFFDQTMSRAGENYKFEMDLDVLAGGASAGASAADPNILQKWCYAGCMLTNVELGEMNYDEQRYMTITCRIRYDNVIGFNQNGVRMGTFRHTAEIAAQQGVASTGIGVTGGINVRISGGSVNVGFTGLSVGGATIGGQVGSGSNGGFGVSF